MTFPTTPAAKKIAQAGCLFFALLCGAAMYFFVDLTPKIEGNFFFSSDDPALQASRKIDKLFATAPQVIITVEGDMGSSSYLESLRSLTSKLSAVDGVVSVRSLTAGPDSPEDAHESPLWRRLLLSEDGKASNLIVILEKEDHRATLEKIISLKTKADQKGFRAAISGVPYVVYEIQQQLLEELRTFSVTALILFSILVLLIFRSFWILAGSILACMTSCFLTFITLELIGMEPGILTANLWGIVFVLTLEHIVFFTANWEIAAREERKSGASLFAAAARATGPASFWAMFATVLGFVALLGGSAKPLFQFGVAGAIGAVISMAVAYAIYPVFLASAHPPQARALRAQRWVEGWIARPNKAVLAVVAVLCLAALPGMFRFNIDPTLFEYFKPGGRLRRDIERIDRQGGISPLEIVVRDRHGAKFNSTEAFEKLWRLQAALEQDPAVGAVISLPVLMAEADRAPLSFLISWEGLLQRMEEPEYGRIAKDFVTSDREQARFMLRIKESQRKGSREAVVHRLKKIVRDHGFDPALVGGLYHLQGQLSSSLGQNLFQGIIGLIVFFSIIAWIVARSWKIALAMIGCLCVMPFSLLGAVSHFGVPLDIVSAPSIDLAIGIGVDTMIHLVSAVRGSRKAAGVCWQDWAKARRRLFKPIAVSSFIIAVGFATLLLSDYPPTRRLGLLVSAGTILWAAITLFVLPTAVYLISGARKS